MALLCCLLAIQNLIVVSQQLILVLLGRIRLLRILETLTQLLNRRRRRRRFHPYWTFPRPVESWFEIRMHQHNFPEAFFRRYLKTGRVIGQLTNTLKRLRSERKHSYIIPFSLVSITKYDDQLKGICQGTIDFLVRQKIVDLQS